MGKISYYDEVEIEDMTWDDEKAVYHWPCPCGDRFEIERTQLAQGHDVATCPSCSLIIRVIFDQMDFEQYADTTTSKTEPEKIVTALSAVAVVG